MESVEYSGSTLMGELRSSSLLQGDGSVAIKSAICLREQSRTGQPAACRTIGFWVCAHCVISTKKGFQRENPAVCG